MFANFTDALKNSEKSRLAGIKVHLPIVFDGILIMRLAYDKQTKCFAESTSFKIDNLELF